MLEIFVFLYSLYFNYLVETNRAREKLQFEYKSRANRNELSIFDNPLGELTVHDAFVELYIVKEEYVRDAWGAKWGEVEDTDNMQHLKMTQRVIDWPMEFTKISVDEIISESKSAVLAGVAGYGKTFLMDYICHEWGSNNLWPQFQLVFMLQCRDLNETLPGQQSLHELLKIYYRTVMNDIDATKLAEMRETVLIIIDGVDELANLDEIVKGTLLTSSQRLFRDLLLQKDGHCVLVTGRPEASFKVKQMISKEKPINSIQTVGFSTEQVYKFMKHYFNSESHEGYQKLLKLMETNAQIAAMCKVPIMIKIISCLYLRVERIQEPRTGTELYIHALVFFIQSHCKIEEEIEFIGQYQLQGTVLEIIKKLGRIAYELLSKGKVLINVKDKLVRDLDLKLLTKSGLLSKTTIAGIEYAVFPHLSLMEILVATHMKIRKLQLRHMTQRQLALAKSFYCGFEGILLSNNGDCFFNFVQSLQSVTIKRKRLLLVKREKDILTQMCSTLRPRFRAFTRFTKGYYPSHGALDIMMCAYEHHNVTQDTLNILGSIKGVEFCFNRMSNLELVQAAYMIEKLIEVKCETIHLTFEFCKNTIDSVEMGRVIQFIPYAKQVSFNNTPLSRTSATHIAHALQNTEIKNWKMARLNLYKCQLADEVLQMLSPYLPYIETVFLDKNPDVTLVGYDGLLKSIISVKDRERRLRVLLVNVRDFDQVSELFKNIQPAIEIEGGASDDPVPSFSKLLSSNSENCTAAVEKVSRASRKTVKFLK